MREQTICTVVENVDHLCVAWVRHLIWLSLGKPTNDVVEILLLPLASQPIRPYVMVQPVLVAFSLICLEVPTSSERSGSRQVMQGIGAPITVTYLIKKNNH